MNEPIRANLSPIADHLFTVGLESVRLIGSRCRQCTVMTFPVQASCPRCGQPETERAEYDPVGTLWTFTTQEFPPKSPPYAAGLAEDFRPYAVGYVEFSGQGVVEGRIECDDPAALRIGMPMETILRPFGGSESAEAQWIYCFRPLQSAEAAT